VNPIRPVGRRASSGYIQNILIKYHLNLSSGCILMFSVNLTFDNTLMMQFCYFSSSKSPLFKAINV